MSGHNMSKKQMNTKEREKNKECQECQEGNKVPILHSLHCV